MPRKAQQRKDRDGSFSPALKEALKARTQTAAWEDESPRPRPGMDVDHLDRLVGTMLFEEGIQFRFTPDRAGRVWAKACIRTSEYPRHYLLASFPPGTPFSACLEGLLRKVEAFQLGALRPSKDEWPG